MDRKEALDLIKSNVGNKNLIKHMLATESCMRSLARYLGENEERWGITGLLHDLDYDQTAQEFSKHGFVSADILKNKGVDERIIYAIKAHPGHVDRKSPLDKSLYAVDPLTGLIVASALMHPDKKLSSLDTEFILRRFKEKRFAAGVNREQIKSCDEIGLSLDEFIKICLEGMQSISEELGL